jgi:hypothetical protein
MSRANQARRPVMLDGSGGYQYLTEESLEKRRCTSERLASALVRDCRRALARSTWKMKAKC